MKSNVFILLQGTVSSSNTEHILKNENSKIPEWKKKKKYKSLSTFLLSEVSRIKIYFPNNRYFSLKEGHTHVYIKEPMRSPPQHTPFFNTSDWRMPKQSYGYSSWSVL